MYFSEVFQIIDRFGIPPPQLYSYVFTIRIQPLGFRDEKWNSHFYTPLDISERKNVAIFIRSKELQSLRRGPALCTLFHSPYFFQKLILESKSKFWGLKNQRKTFLAILGWVGFQKFKICFFVLGKNWTFNVVWCVHQLWKYSLLSSRALFLCKCNFFLAFSEELKEVSDVRQCIIDKIFWCLLFARTQRTKSVEKDRCRFIILLQYTFATATNILLWSSNSHHPMCQQWGKWGLSSFSWCPIFSNRENSLIYAKADTDLHHHGSPGE